MNSFTTNLLYQNYLNMKDEEEVSLYLVMFHIFSKNIAFFYLF